MSKNISIIVAITANNGIGYKNELLTHIPGDLKRFKEITTGYPVIMGRNTFLSLPNGPLPNRTNIVITDTNQIFEGCVTVTSIEEAISACPPEKECFVMGGGMIYKQFLPIANKLYLTVVEKEFKADTFFPEINPEEWQLMEEQRFEVNEKAEFAFSYQTYSRK